ncbi:hypothetical protein [Verrucomicrobium sp. BvORR034]|uniref:hypothetical protein n=1 Tax=Verrucomicrobium sp. BvORR034 TaxID=1396418 RepID=UPI0006787952|nr:hypothetical protein [Verrucomicrobium sp. BvORR034]
MKCSLFAALLAGLFLVPLHSEANEEGNQLRGKILETLGNVFDCTITTEHIKVPGMKRPLLRIKKNDLPDNDILITGAEELVIIRCQGPGMGVAPRSPELGLGLQIRVLVKGANSESVVSVSYTVPENTAKTVVTTNGDLPLLFNRIDLARDGKTILGQLEIRLEDSK